MGPDGQQVLLLEPRAEPHKEGRHGVRAKHLDSGRRPARTKPHDAVVRRAMTSHRGPIHRMHECMYAEHAASASDTRGVYAATMESCCNAHCGQASCPRKPLPLSPS